MAEIAIIHFTNYPRGQTRSCMSAVMKYTMPHIHLPRPTLAWLIVPAVLLGLLALWYGWVAFWNGLATLLP